jgi:circadian clock protein KaiC
MSLSPSDTVSSFSGSFEPTGVPHLDRVLGGGLLRGALTIIMGPPGSGKTTLASQIAFAAAHRGQRALLLTALSESTTKLLTHLQTYQFYSAELLGDAVQIFSLKQFLPSISDVAATSQEIVAAVRQTRANIVVLDGFQSIRGADIDFASTRELLYELGVRLSLLGTTTLITTEAQARDPKLFPEMTTGDVLIGLYYTLSGVRSFRSLEAIKVRGGAHLLGRHSMRLSEQGVEVFPRPESRVKSLSFDEWPILQQTSAKQSTRALFDLPVLDALLGGGLPYRTSTLLTGSLGTGKTLLALHFALAGITKGEPVLFLGFRETAEQLLLKADTFDLGKELRQALAPGGLLRLQRWEPIEIDPDRVATALLTTLEQMGARRVVIDSVLELERSIRQTSGAERIPDFMASLLAILREHGVTLLTVKETQHSLSTQPDFSADPLAVLAENVILLQHLVHRNQLRRVLSILKMRFSSHDHSLREFQVIPPQGIRVLSPEESGQDASDLFTKFYGGWGGGALPPLDKDISAER